MYLIQFNIIFTFLVQCYTLFYRPLIIAYTSYCILSPYFCPKSLAVFYTFISLSLLILFLPFLYEHCANSSYTFLFSCRLMSKLFAFLLCAVKGLPDPAVNKCIFLLSLFLFFSASLFPLFAIYTRMSLVTLDTRLTAIALTGSLSRRLSALRSVHMPSGFQRRLYS